MNEYLIDNTRKFIHADLYRLENAREISGIGLEDYFYGGFLVFHLVVTYLLV